jgi:hypothetical protein
MIDPGFVRLSRYVSLVSTEIFIERLPVVLSDLVSAICSFGTSIDI